MALDSSSAKIGWGTGAQLGQGCGGSLAKGPRGPPWGLDSTQSWSFSTWPGGRRAKRGAARGSRC
eukprot:9967216-Alexandrium_andersonii.AAC.1